MTARLRDRFSRVLRSSSIGSIRQAATPWLRTPKSLRAAGRELDWPAGISGGYNYPNGKSGIGTTGLGYFGGTGTGSSDRQYNYNIQGVTHDANAWYFSTADMLFRIPKQADLEDPSAISFMNIVESGAGDWGHLGDIDYVSELGLLIGALERTNGSPPISRIGVWAWTASGFAFIGAADMLLDRNPVREPRNILYQESNSWCAYNPADQLVYSSYSYWYDDPDFDDVPVVVFAYRLSVGVPVLRVAASNVGFLELRDEAGVPIRSGRLRNIQGGVFSRDGRLYLAVEFWEGRPGGIMGFDTVTGRRVLFHPVDFNPLAKREFDSGGVLGVLTTVASVFTYATGGGAATLLMQGLYWREFISRVVRQDELEGLTLWDLDGAGVPGMDGGGQLHLVVSQGGFRLFFKHYRLNDR